MKQYARGILSPQEYRSANRGVMHTAFVACALLLTAVMFYPFLWVFAGALKTPSEIFSLPPSFLPKEWHWENFAAAWRFYEFPRMMLNSTILFLGFLVSKLFVITLASYSLSRLRLPARRALYLLFLATLMLPAVAYLVPSYLVIQRLPVLGISLLDSRWSIWLPAGADSFSLLMMKGFFDEIPREISESGRIDGAGDLGILARLILPLSRPIVAVIGIFAFLGIWNDFFWQRLVLVSPDKWTISVMLWFRSTVTGATPPVNVQLAAMFLSILPPMALFLAFQRSITEGVVTSGLKG